MPASSPERLRRDLVSLAHRGLEVREYSLGAARILRRAVGFDGVCVLTLDPATLLPTGEVVENGLPPDATARMAEIEVGGEDDFNKFGALARAEHPAARLSEATGGDLDRSRRHREVRRPHGFGDELRAALVSDSTAWGAITLLREVGGPEFTPSDAAVVAAVSHDLAEGLRRAVVRGALSAAKPGQEPAGLVILEDDNSIALMNPAGEECLAELLDGATPAGHVPGVITAVAARSRSAASGDALSDARARVRTSSGRWLHIHASAVGEGAEARSVVILEPARTPELAPLIADAYGLTERERLVTQLVAQGLDTNAIGERLYLSPWTVQDHLKSIFEKTGVGTRGELVARIFFEHYAPRLAEPPAPPRAWR
jgi:DNA-binding CsgD family transcriptional regulator